MSKKKDNIFYKNDFWIRLSLTIFFMSILLIILIEGNIQLFFSKTNYVSSYQNYDFQLHVIDVGQGDSFLIKFPNDKVVLIDTGEEEEGQNVVNYIKEFLKRENLTQIDYLLLTHQDSDHVGGAVEVLKEIKVENVFRPKVLVENEVQLIEKYPNYTISNTQTYSNVINLAYHNNCNILFNESGLKLDFEGAIVEFLSPSEDVYSNSNDYSAVLMITYQTKKFLFMGDASVEIEQKLIENYGENLKCDVLKVGHHGSKTSSSEEFLKLISPTYSIISAEEKSDLPSSIVTNNLNAIGSKILSTANFKNFALTVKNNKIIYSLSDKPFNELALFLSIILLIIILIWGIKINKNKKMFINTSIPNSNKTIVKNYDKENVDVI